MPVSQKGAKARARASQRKHCEMAKKNIRTLTTTATTLQWIRIEMVIFFFSSSSFSPLSLCVPVFGFSIFARYSLCIFSSRSHLRFVCGIFVLLLVFCFLLLSLRQYSFYWMYLTFICAFWWACARALQNERPYAKYTNSTARTFEWKMLIAHHNRYCCKSINYYDRHIWVQAYSPLTLTFTFRIWLVLRLSLLCRSVRYFSIRIDKMPLARRITNVLHFRKCERVSCSDTF